MTKKQTKQNDNEMGFYDKLLEKRKLIMVVILFIIAPLLFLTASYTVTYTNNKPNPFSDVSYEYTKTTIEEINKNKFVVEEYHLSQFALFLEDEVYDDGQIELNALFGERIDKNIQKNSQVSVQYYVCYNWANVTSSTTTMTAYVDQMTSAVQRSLTFDATSVDTKPFFFKSVDLQKDARIVAMFSWYEDVDGEDTKVYYLVESSYKDLYISGETNLQK